VKHEGNNEGKESRQCPVKGVKQTQRTIMPELFVFKCIQGQKMLKNSTSMCRERFIQRRVPDVKVLFCKYQPY